MCGNCQGKFAAFLGFNTLKTIAIHIIGDAPASGINATLPRPKEVSFGVYVYKDTNGLVSYFKIRDLAYVLNGTLAQFNATWGGNSTKLIPNIPYEPNSNEMTDPFG